MPYGEAHKGFIPGEVHTDFIPLILIRIHTPVYALRHRYR